MGMVEPCKRVAVHAAPAEGDIMLRPADVDGGNIGTEGFFEVPVFRVLIVGIEGPGFAQAGGVVVEFFYEFAFGVAIGHDVIDADYGAAVVGQRDVGAGEVAGIGIELFYQGRFVDLAKQRLREPFT